MSINRVFRYALTICVTALVLSSLPSQAVTAQATTVPTVTSFTLINADTGADLATFTSSGAVSIVQTPRISIRANASNTVSVSFVEGAFKKIENAAPFALRGNAGKVYYPWSPSAGTYVINATPYTGKSASGTAGAVAKLNLTVTQVGTPPNPGFEEVSHTYPANAGPDRNPHKGWNSDRNKNQPESSVGFQYLSWKVFEPTNGKFDYNKVEELLAKDGTKGKHFVLRLYCEWHHRDNESNCPSWIYNEVGVPRLSGDNGSALTDFNDPRYLDEAVQAIQALAERYDGDPRVHAFQMGVLGCWGEWHDCSFKQNGVDYEISDVSKERILQAYKTYFKKSPIQGRYPWREPLKSAGFIGYHNDFFIPNNKHSNEFDAALAAGGQWQNGPIGGEVPPRSSSQATSERAALYTTSAGKAMIETGHYSTMNVGSTYRALPGETYYTDYMRLHRMMGYNFRIDQALFAENVSTATSGVTVQLDGRNVGVAPLYHPWDVEFALLNSQGQVVSRAAPDTQIDLSAVNPGDAFSMTAFVSMSGVPVGSYQLAVRLIQPDAGVAKTSPWKLDARNAYIVFANNLPVIDGQWDSGNRLVGGWSVLGPVTLR
jgi:hypothetical protein